MSSVKNIIKRKLNKLITTFYDPLVNINIGKEIIKVPLSHQIRENVLIYPDLNYNLPRIIKYLSTKIDDIKIIDIGANVGDTVAYIRNYSNAPILCIDGDSKYIDILKQNVSQYKDISICAAIVGGETKEINATIKKERGTGFLTDSKDKISMRTMENILLEFPDFKKSKVLKTDTDGFDTIILRASVNFLKEISPILFFEFDPHLIKKNNDDPFDFIAFLEECGYYYFMFYTNIGEYIVSCSSDEKDILIELVQYFSGRKLDLFADICAFTKADKGLFELCKENEINHFRKARNF